MPKTFTSSTYLAYYNGHTPNFGRAEGPCRPQEGVVLAAPQGAEVPGLFGKEASFLAPTGYLHLGRGKCIRPSELVEGIPVGNSSGGSPVDHSGSASRSLPFDEAPIASDTQGTPASSCA